MEILLNDATGCIELHPQFCEDLNLISSESISQLDLRQESIFIFGKKVLQPRLSRFYSDPGVSYTYSKQLFEGQSWTKDLRVLKDAIEEKRGYAFNSALVNYYRDGNDSMGLHADNEPELGRNPVIASMNYGATRKMIFRKNDSKEKISVELKHGDLLLMSGELQHQWKHELPKQRRVQSDRLNITFRKIY